MIIMLYIQQLELVKTPCDELVEVSFICTEYCSDKCETCVGLENLLSEIK